MKHILSVEFSKTFKHFPFEKGLISLYSDPDLPHFMHGRLSAEIAVTLQIVISLFHLPHYKLLKLMASICGNSLLHPLIVLLILAPLDVVLAL